MKTFTGNKALKLKILNIIKNEGPTTKQKIAFQLKLNITTISNLVNSLSENDKLLIELGDEGSSGGRKPKLYQINEKIWYVVGINIGAKNTSIIISSLLGKIISSTFEKTEYDKSGEQIVDKVVSAVNKLIAETNIDRKNILGYGIGIPGCIDIRDGRVVFCPNINGLKNMLLKNIFELRFNNSVFVDDSMRCLAIAEKKFGSAKSYNNFIFIGFGKGIGSGIYIDGKIYRGNSGAVGEIGHTTVKEDGPVCSCGNKGCLEAIASEPAIVKRTADGIASGIVTTIPPEGITLEEIVKASQEGDKFAYHIINNTGEYIGIAIATALNLFGSDLVILGGIVTQCGDMLINAIERTVKLRALDTISKKVKIVCSELDRNYSAVGAAINIIDEIFEDPELNIINKIDLMNSTI
jgi:N-acetylglucosamine repressor